MLRFRKHVKQAASKIASLADRALEKPTDEVREEVGFPFELFGRPFAESNEDVHVQHDVREFVQHDVQSPALA